MPNKADLNLHKFNQNMHQNELFMLQILARFTYKGEMCVKSCKDVSGRFRSIIVQYFGPNRIYRENYGPLFGHFGPLFGTFAHIREILGSLLVIFVSSFLHDSGHEFRGKTHIRDKMWVKIGQFVSRNPGHFAYKGKKWDKNAKTYVRQKWPKSVTNFHPFCI